MYSKELGMRGLQNNMASSKAFNNCFGFTKMDAGEIGRIKKAAFGGLQSAVAA